ncbi:MAG: glycerophosphodiester phosphodiesterase, partial [Firmicutes bacterium]|nr:glycerophosphodiester phosphodiesterase [Bacillota bacterium]
MVYIVGHRGAAGIRPENTIPSFRLAGELGVDRLDCDVRLSEEGHAVLMHDATVDRTTNGTGRVSDLILEEIRALDAGGGEKVPLLGEYLAFLKQTGIPSEVEIKDPAALETVLEEIRDHDVVELVCITAKLETATRAKEILPGIDVGLPTANPSREEIEQAARIGASGVGIRYDHLTEELVKFVQGLGLEARGWNPV